MTTLRIAEVAEWTGVPATTLRYYEDIGLLAPAERTRNGYRAYSDRDVERLRFITRAKQLDISLDDLRELVVAWDGEDCGDVQERMVHVVSARLAETRERLVQLAELARQLESAAARLSTTAPHAGACDDGCACSTAHLPVDVAISATPPAVACTLDAGAMRGRMGDWQALLARAVDREPVPDGVALTFDHDADLTGELARLAAAEHGCCSFLDFTLGITGDGVRFEIRAPAEAHEVLADVFGPVGTAATR